MTDHYEASLTGNTAANEPEAPKKEKRGAAYALSKCVRVVTVAPVMALLTVALLYAVEPAVFGGPSNLALAVIFLTVFPISAYPLQKMIPMLRQQGREGQRNLALVMAVLGYVGSMASLFVVSAPVELWVLYLTYFISGVGIVVINKVFKIKASGHACGVAGPMFLLIYYIGAYALFGLLLLALVYVTSLIMKRHTLSQLIWGTFVPLCALGLAVLLGATVIEPMALAA